MTINESIRFFRKNNRQTQKEVISEEISIATFSRFESGKGDLAVGELLLITDKLSLTFEELLAFSDSQTEQANYENLYFYCASHLDNQEKKAQLVKYYQSLNKKKNQTLREYSNLLGIKSFFSKYWQEIPRLTKVDVHEGYLYLLEREYFTHYDYSILLKLSVLLDYKEANTLMRRALPIQNLEKRSEKTKFFALNILRNMITNRLYQGDLHNTYKFIAYAKKQLENTSDYKIKIHITFFEYLTRYLETKEVDYYTKIINIINMMQDIGAEQEAEGLKHDMKLLIDKKQTLNLFEDEYEVFPY